METGTVFETILQKMRLYGAELVPPLARAIGLTTEQLRTQLADAEAVETDDQRYRDAMSAHSVVRQRIDAIKLLKIGRPFTLLIA